MPLVVYLGAARLFVLNEAYMTKHTAEPDAAIQTIDYMLGRGDSLPDTFSEREATHMRDVRKLTRNAAIYFYLMLTFMVGAVMLWLSTAEYRNIRWLFLGGALATTLFTVVVALASTKFSSFWQLLHQPFFPAGSWQFGSEDYLIILFPLSFFRQAVTTIILNSLIVTWTAVVIERCLNLVAKKKNLYY